MNLMIETNIPPTDTNSVVIKFAKALSKRNFDLIDELFQEDIRLIRFDKETLIGKSNISDYFKDWLDKFEDKFDIHVKWFPYNAQASIVFESENLGNLYLIFRVKNSIIEEIVITNKWLKDFPSFFEELPYNIEFIKANATMDIEPFENHLSCPECGKSSLDLNWKNGVIYKERGYREKAGIIFNVSCCPNCNRLVEVSPDKRWSHMLTMSYKQEQEILSRLTEEEKSQYEENSYGNKKPVKEFNLPSIINDLSTFGKKFYDFLGDHVKDVDTLPHLALKYLDKIKLDKEVEMKLHEASLDDGTDFDEDCPF